eukprot:2690496-Alexandrium_andersonii.AAC.1
MSFWAKQFKWRTPQAIFQVRATTYPNNTLAEIEKGPTFHMDEAAVRAGPARRNGPCPGLGIGGTQGLR